MISPEGSPDNRAIFRPGRIRFRASPPTETIH